LRVTWQAAGEERAFSTTAPVGEAVTVVIETPSEARVILGGNALLVADVDSSDEYRVQPLGQRISALRAAP